MSRRNTREESFGTGALLGVLVAGILLLGGCGPKSHMDAGEEEEVELASLMGEMQRHGAKLGYSIQGRNLPLAEFYLHEVEEVLEELLEVGEHDGLPIGATARKIAVPALPPLEEALEHERWGEAEAAYGKLIESCNRCHAATEHEYVVILEPEGPPPFNQRFTREPGEAPEEGSENTP